jgi:hypothetical protein
MPTLLSMMPKRVAAKRCSGFTYQWVCHNSKCKPRQNPQIADYFHDEGEGGADIA